MSHGARLARVLRALTGQTQADVARERGMDPNQVGHIERGRVAARPEFLEPLARGAGITLREAEELLRLYEAFRGAHLCRHQDPEELIDGLGQGVRDLARAARRRVLHLSIPGQEDPAIERRKAEELWKRLRPLPEASRSAVIQVSEEFQTWALCERICAESVAEASRDVQQAASLARLAQGIAQRLSEPEAVRNCFLGYATAHVANILRVNGELPAADATFTAAKTLWQSGSAPAGTLDPGRMLALESSLRRAQRRFGEAISLLDQALEEGKSPTRVLIQKGATLEAMGEPKRAIETLLEAMPLVEKEGDRRLMNILLCNLGLAYCQANRFAEAAEIASRVLAGATEMGDAIGALRALWLQGRVAAGLGRTEEALDFLGQARRQFAVRGMDYDVALALLEEAALLLDQGKVVEVELLARDLARVFRSKGVHREALAALQLFQRQRGEADGATGDTGKLCVLVLLLAAPAGAQSVTCTASGVQVGILETGGATSWPPTAASSACISS